MEKHPDDPAPYSETAGSVDPIESLTEKRIQGIEFLMPSHADVASAVVVSLKQLNEASIRVDVTVRGILHTQVYLRAKVECGENGAHYIVAEQIDLSTKGSPER